MRKALAFVCVVAAVGVSAAAAAMPAAVTRTQAATRIEARWKDVSDASCRPLTMAEWDGLSLTTYVVGGVRYWNHFACEADVTLPDGTEQVATLVFNVTGKCVRCWSIADLSWRAA